MTVPSGQIFSDSLLHAHDQNEPVLFVYSLPENPTHLFKYILVDGNHKSTITSDTFARITLEPGRHRIRILQHGWSSPEPWIIRNGKNESIQAKLEVTKDMMLEPGGVSFLGLGRGKRQVYRDCAESETATKICREEVNGLVLEEVSREVALPVLSPLREACESCE